MGIDSHLTALAQLAEAQHDHVTDETFWRVLEHCVTTLFGQKLFTVLLYDAENQRMARVYSNRLDINPVGGVKRVTPSHWTNQLLHVGNVLIGSTKEDIQAVFSDHRVLHGIGCDSVFNIPVRAGGRTLGTLNLLDVAHRYDHADHGLAIVVAQLCAPRMMDRLAWLAAIANPAQMEQV